MNEFIVWDEEEKEFYQVDTLVMTNGGMREAKVTPLPENCDYECFTIFGWEYSHNDQICNYIGKTDINGKKIYADCSIVEFEFMKEMSREGSYDYEATKHIGFFEYDKDRLSYGIRLLGVLNDWIKFDIFMLLNFKIIDTIQENKLGLYNKDK